MSTAWVAGSVRAVSLAQRRLGAGGARDLARSADLEAAVDTLTRSPYGHDVRPGHTLAEAQHAVGATLLWHLRVLAGWQPRAGADIVRLLAAGFEIADAEEHLHRLAGGEAEPPYALGTLETAWTRLAATRSLADVRAVLTASPWGDPGGATARLVLGGMRLSWADRVEGGVPEAAGWARAAVVLMLLREALLADRPLPGPLRRSASYVVGPAVVDLLSGGRATPADVARLLPSDSRWVLDGVTAATDLWRAEGSWWTRVESDGFRLLRRPGFDRSAVVGAVALLCVDAWRVRAALEVAARGGSGQGQGQGPGHQALGVFDAVA